MCGRFAQTTEFFKFKELFALDNDEFEKWRDQFLQSNYNVSPMQKVITLIQLHKRVMIQMLWNFNSPWKSHENNYSLINIRLETLKSKPVFTSIADKHRCIVPIDGFFEWIKNGKNKSPLYFYHNDRKPFFIAGIYQIIDNNHQFSIITTTANDVIKNYHDRMPLILDYTSIDAWLAIDKSFPQAITECKALSSHDISYYPVTPKMNKSNYSNPDSIEPYHGDTENTLDF